MSRLDGDGRTDRASLQVTTRLALTGMDAVAFDTTDARIERPYSGYTSELHYLSGFDGDGRTDRASLQVATRLIRLLVSSG